MLIQLDTQKHCKAMLSDRLSRTLLYLTVHRIYGQVARAIYEAVTWHLTQGQTCTVDINSATFNILSILRQLQCDRH